MSNKKKRTHLAKEAVWTTDKNLEVLSAWKVFQRGNREPLLSILQRDLYKLNSPELERVLLQLASQASVTVKRNRGRPPETSKAHIAAEREEIARRVSWLIKIKPMLRNPRHMTKKNAYRLVAAQIGVNVAERTIKEYCREFKSK